MDVATAVAIVAVLLGVPAVFFLIRSLAQAGRGSFLKERNEELASAYEQVQQQRANEHADCQRQISSLRDEINQVKGELSAYRLQYARSVAQDLIKEFRAAGVLPPTNGA